MEREGQGSSSEPSQTAEEEQNRISEKRRVIMAVTQMLDSGTLDEKSLRLLEQLADCVQCSQAEATREAGPFKQAAAQQATPARGEPVEVAWDLCAPRQKTDGHARCHRALEGSTASRSAGFFTEWTRKTGSS